MVLYQVFFIFSFFAFTFAKLNINNTFLEKLYVSMLADQLIGASSSNFPGASLINYLLYGQSDAGYGFKDFLQNYGIESTEDCPGCIIVGNDGLFGGIIGTNYYNAILPIPFDKVREIPITDLKKYFPKGYKIKANKHQPNFGYFGVANGNFEDSFECINCDDVLMTYNETEKFFVSEIYELQFFNMTSNKGLLMGVYNDQFSQKYQNGTFRIPFFALLQRNPMMIKWYMNNNLNLNYISFSIDHNQQVLFSGAIKYSDPSKSLNFTFSGSINPFSEKK